ncbi:MAG TPA: hypothetical protein VFI42_15910 [Thermomicrobiaceae bacterium]|nr:hypothetical protein [Thermomicrobiaceae bacterium]
MKSYIRRLRWLILLGGFCAACSIVKPLPGKVGDKPGLADAQALIWRTAYHRTDASPLVYVVEGDELSCTDPNSGKPGFECTSVGCREGCTASPLAVHVAFDGGQHVNPNSTITGQRWSDTTLAHEDEHAKKIRDALELLRYTPRTADALLILGDRNHEAPEWQPGGEVDQANRLLQERGL